MPWYISLALSITAILFGVSRKLNIGLTMLLGSLVLGLFSGLTFNGVIRTLISGTINPTTVMLVIAILLLGSLGNILKQTGSLEQMIENMQSIIGDIRIIAVAVTSTISMLTVPGGAILSAPLCAETGEKINLPPLRQAVVNIWFRHVLYFILPLFPSMVLTSQLSGVSLNLLFLINLPVFLTGFLFGFYYLFKGYRGEETNFNFTAAGFLKLIRSIAPIIIILLLIICTDIYFPLALLAGVILSLFNYLPGKNWPQEVLKRLKSMVFQGMRPPVAFVIIGIMIYKEMLTNSHVIENFTEVIFSMGIPIIILVAFIPFLIGLLTGDNAASVVVTLPMFIPLLPSSQLAYSAYIAFIYASSTAGHIVSPAHPCFSLTTEYHGVDFRNIILCISPMLAMALLTGFIVTLILTLI